MARHVLISLIAFDTEACAALLNLRKGDACAVTGRGKLTRWTTKDGELRHGLSLVAERVMSGYDVGKRRAPTPRHLHWGESVDIPGR